MVKKLSRLNVGSLPLMESIVRKINLRAILEEFFPKEKKEGVTTVDTLILLIYNLAVGKIPLYELENWVGSLDLSCIGLEKYQNTRFSDDRFGKALDSLFAVDRASLMTRIVLEAIKAFKIDLKQLHNDSTSVKAFGKYSGKTKSDFELKRGKSKDFRPDLKQLVYSLSITADGAVPIHFKAYPGNRNDDTTHIETWNTLCQINQSPNFLYVADCKLCSDKQLSHISENGGRALAPIPNFWNEVTSFKDSLRREKKSKKEVWRRKNEELNKMTYFSAYDEEQLTINRGYKIIWIHSSERQKDDFQFRQECLKKAEDELFELLPKLNKRKWKSEEVIKEECNKILKHRKVDRFIQISISHKNEIQLKKTGKGRPQNSQSYQSIEKAIYSLTWSKDKVALEAEKNVDGVYPLLSTDHKLSPKEAIMAYKYQPNLEKRFSQLKSIHNIAPLFCKKLERIEANMFVFFVSLIIQALIEREVRHRMKDTQILALQIYPENRDAVHPTTSKIFDCFSQISTYKVVNREDIIETYSDDLDDLQKNILKLLCIDEGSYWNKTRKSA